MIMQILNRRSRRGLRIGATITAWCTLALIAPLGAQDFGSSFSVSQGIAAQSMIQSVGDTTNQIVNLIMGPGMFVVMALGAVLALFGWARGNKESLWTGLVLFVLAAILRGIWSFM